MKRKEAERDALVAKASIPSGIFPRRKLYDDKAVLETAVEPKNIGHEVLARDLDMGTLPRPLGWHAIAVNDQCLFEFAVVRCLHHQLLTGASASRPRTSSTFGGTEPLYMHKRLLFDGRAIRATAIAFQKAAFPAPGRVHKHDNKSAWLGAKAAINALLLIIGSYRWFGNGPGLWCIRADSPGETIRVCNRIEGSTLVFSA